MGSTVLSKSRYSPASTKAPITTAIKILIAVSTKPSPQGLASAILALIASIFALWITLFIIFFMVFLPPNSIWNFYLHTTHLHGRRGLLQCVFLRLHRSLIHGYGLLVAVQHSLVELLPELLGDGEADFLVAVLGLAAGHGDEQSVTTALHHLDAPDAKAAVHRCRSIGTDAAAGTGRVHGIDFYIYIGHDFFSPFAFWQ